VNAIPQLLAIYEEEFAVPWSLYLRVLDGWMDGWIDRLAASRA
jgi:hypothetical protein